MFCTPVRTVDARSNGTWILWTWRFGAEQEGEPVELPITRVLGVQVVGEGEVTLLASLDRKHWQPVATYAGAGLHTVPLLARYLRVDGRGMTVHVMIGVDHK